MSNPHGSQDPGEQAGQQYPAAPPPGGQQPYGAPPQYNQQQPYGGAQQSPYGQQGYMPTAPALTEDELRKPERPTTVTVAFVVWLVSAALGLITSIIQFAQGRELMEAAGTDVGSGAMTAATVFGLVLVAGLVASVFAMRAGHNWARILLTVLGALAVLGGLMELGRLGLRFEVGGSFALVGVIQLMQMILMATALVCMYVGGANRYFKLQ